MGIQQVDIAGIMQRLQVNKVIFVDDVLDQFTSAELIKDLVFKLDVTIAQQLFTTINFSLPKAVVERNITVYWESLAYNQRRQIFLEVANVVDNEYSLSMGCQVSEMFPEGFQYEEYPPNEWEEKVLNKLHEFSEERKLLLIIDWKLGEKDGLQFLLQAKEKAPNNSILLVLLSSAFEINNERDTARDHQLTTCNIVPLSKERLESPAEFVTGISLAFLNYLAERLLTDLFSFINQSVHKAQLSTLGLYASDIIQVINYSREEAVWEASSLLRLYNIHYADEIRFLTESEEAKKKLNSQVKTIIEVSEVYYKNQKHSPTKDILELKYKESYCDGILYNELLTPISLGDIFKVNDTYYILLAQPCDLMLRTGRIQNVFLAKIKTECSQSDLGYKLNLFNKQESNHYVFFKRYLTLPITVLDMTTYNKDGKCKIHLTGDPPITLEHYSRQQFKIVQKKMKKLEQVVNFLNGVKTQPVKEEIERAIFAQFDKIGKPCFSNGIAEFHSLERVGHIRRAEVILNKFVNSLSRPAEPGDFTMGYFQLPRQRDQGEAEKEVSIS